MGKRTRDKSDEEIRSKIKRLQKELESRKRSPSPVNQNEDPEYDAYNNEHEELELETHDEGGDSEVPGENSLEQSHENVLSTQGEDNLVPLEILAILGEAKKSEETFGKKIPTEISERWGKILLEGLTKDQKEELLTKTLVPENFQLAKAPKLNAEVASVLNEPTKNRDKRLERMQSQLGSGIAGLANLTSELISQDLSKIEIIKQIAEINQILLDLHYEETMNRRRLIIPLLDKSFISIIQGVKREKFLFGDNLSENIRMTKSIERSSLQIKKSIPTQQSIPRRPNATVQGNVRAPLRQPSGQGAARAAQAQARFYLPPPAPASRRPPPATRRAPPQLPQYSRAQERRSRR